MATDIGSMSAEQIVADSKRYTLYDWQAQSKASPLAIDRAEGVYMYGADGRRWLDFSSQLMGVNIGHGDKRVTEAIARQAEKLPYISPFQAFEGRAVLGKRLAGLWPGDIEKTFFTLAGAEANENAVKIAKLVTGRQKVMARYRSYHGSTYGTMMLTGDPRRWPNEQPPMPGRRARARPLPRSAARVRRRADGARDPGRDDRAGRAADDRGVHPGDRRRHERHPDPARRLHAGRPRALHEVRHRDDRRRGDVRLGPDR